MSKPFYKLYSKSHKLVNRQYVDADYINKLSEEEKQWLNQFLHEYYDLAYGKYEEPLHNTPELKTSLGDADNARRRDIVNPGVKPKFRLFNYFSNT